VNRFQRVVAHVRRRLHWEREWAEESKRPTWLVEGPREQVQAACEDGWIEPGASVVDLGCGMGNSAAWLAEQGHRVWAVDFARSAIRRGRARYGTVPRLRLDRVDVTRPMRVDQPFDVVLDLGCVHQLPGSARPAYAANVRRLTRPGSRLLVLMRVWGSESARSPADKGAALNKHLGGDFELVRAAPTQLQGEQTGASTPGVELRYVRRAARTR
jgi:SAM-dependent methyltransferase